MSAILECQFIRLFLDLFKNASHDQKSLIMILLLIPYERSLRFSNLGETNRPDAKVPFYCSISRKTDNLWRSGNWLGVSFVNVQPLTRQ